MPLIERPEAELLQERLRGLIRRPVQIDLFLRREVEHFRVDDHAALWPQAQQFLEELAALWSQIALRVRPLPEEQVLAEELGVHEVPAIVLSGAARGRVRFLGVPLGGELTSLLEDLVDVSRGVTDLSAASRERLAGLDAPVHLQLFVTSSCPHCPQVARLVHKLAIESPWIEADVIDAEELPGLAHRHGIRAVPSLIVAGGGALAGGLPEELLVEEVLRASRRASGHVSAV